MQQTYKTTVRVLAKESRKPLQGVKVGLFDRDEKSDDDLLGVAITNSVGEASFTYTRADFTDDALGTVDDSRIPRPIINGDIYPDLYAVLYDDDDAVILSERDNATKDYQASVLVVHLDEALAADNGLLDD